MLCFVRSGVTKLVILCDTWDVSNPTYMGKPQSCNSKKAQMPASRGSLRYFEIPALSWITAYARAFRAMVKNPVLQGFRAPTKQDFHNSNHDRWTGREGTVERGDKEASLFFCSQQY